MDLKTLPIFSPLKISVRINAKRFIAFYQTEFILRKFAIFEVVVIIEEKLSNRRTQKFTRKNVLVLLEFPHKFLDLKGSGHVKSRVLASRLKNAVYWVNT